MEGWNITTFSLKIFEENRRQKFQTKDTGSGPTESNSKRGQGSSWKVGPVYKKKKKNYNDILLGLYRRKQIPDSSHRYILALTLSPADPCCTAITENPQQNKRGKYPR
jgi:hypothetical protein